MDKDTYSNVMEEKPGMTFSQAYSAKVAAIIIRPGFLHHHHSQLSSSKGCRSSGYCAHHLWVDSASSKHNRNHVRCKHPPGSWNLELRLLYCVRLSWRSRSFQHNQAAGGVNPGDVDPVQLGRPAAPPHLHLLPLGEQQLLLSIKLTLAGN